MSITITEKAAEEVIRAIANEDREEGTFLRVGIASGGCSGYSYNLAFDDKYDEANDDKSEQHGVMVVVDKKSSLFLEGTKLDFYEGVDKRGFHFDNPNVTRSCGCGSSFQA